MSGNTRSSIFTVRADVPFTAIGLKTSKSDQRRFPVPGGSAKIVTFLLQGTEMDGPLDVTIGLASGQDKTITVDYGAADANFGDPLAMPTPTIVYQLGALAAGVVVAWLLLADRKKRR